MDVNCDVIVSMSVSFSWCSYRVGSQHSWVMVRSPVWSHEALNEGLSVDVNCVNIIRYDMIDDLHWKTDRQAASLI